MTNLPSNQTANTSFLIGTQSLALLPDGVMPDYIIAEGFIDVDLADRIDFSFFDVFSLDGLPLDGENSLNRRFAGLCTRTKLTIFSVISISRRAMNEFADPTTRQNRTGEFLHAVEP